jgi:hypothetical protein
MSKLALAAAPLLGIALPLIGAAMHKLSWEMGVLLAILLLILGLVFDYWLVMRKGAKPFPASGATLPRVLKALYLQQAFVRFAGDQQHGDPAAAGAAFRDFLETYRPRELAAPTQPPGVIRTIFPGAAS